jgi:hypothetical protein
LYPDWGFLFSGTEIAIIHVHFQTTGLNEPLNKHTMNTLLATVNVPDTTSTLALLAIAVALILVARFKTAAR